MALPRLRSIRLARFGPALCLLAILAGCATAPEAPIYDCSERLSNDTGGFEAEGRYSRWSTFVSSGPAAGLGTYIGYVEWLAVAGASPDTGSRHFSFSPPLSLRQRSVWLDLRIGQTSLPRLHLRRTGGRYSPADIPADTLAPLLATGDELVVTFLDDDGHALDRVTMPTSYLRDAPRTLGEMQVRALERSRNPAQYCMMIEEIVVT